MKIILLFLVICLTLSKDCSNFNTCKECIKEDGCGWYSDSKLHSFKCVEGDQFNCFEKECKESHLYWKFHCPIDDYWVPTQSRRSIRKYLDVQISKDIIYLIIENGIWAPSCKGYEPLKFYVVQEQKFLKNISDAAGVGFDIFYGSPTVLFIFVKPGDKVCDHLRDIDAGLAIMNIELMAHNFGLSTCTIGFSVNAEQTIRDIVQPGQGEEYVIAVTLGHGAEMHEKDRKQPFIKYV